MSGGPKLGMCWTRGATSLGQPFFIHTLPSPAGQEAQPARAGHSLYTHFPAQPGKRPSQPGPAILYTHTSQPRTVQRAHPAWLHPTFHILFFSRRPSFFLPSSVLLPSVFLPSSFRLPSAPCVAFLPFLGFWFGVLTKANFCTPSLTLLCSPL